MSQKLAIVAAFVRRDWRIATSYRATVVLELASILFFLALFFYLSHLVDNAKFEASQGTSGGGYFGYAAVGLALLQIVTISLNSFSRKLREEQTTGTFEALMATPTSPSLIVLSSAVYELLRAAVSGVALLIVAVLVFGLHIDTDPASLFVSLVALVGFLGLFASLGVGVAAFTVLYKRALALLGMVVTGLALLGGVYFPVDVLPAPLDTIAKLIPFTWGLDVVRASLLGGDVDLVKLAGLFAAAIVLLPMSLALFRGAVRRARRTGVLAAY
jgi:ABC-2 type transport system permease protein